MPILIRMTLPPGFQWTKANRLAPGGPDVIAYEGTWVVQLWQRVDSEGWVAQLDRHRQGEGPARLRACSGYAQGRSGAQAWVWRHHVRLATEVQQARRLRESLRFQWRAVPQGTAGRPAPVTA